MTNVQRYSIIGDVHGCFDELQELVHLDTAAAAAPSLQASSDVAFNRTLVFVGDLVDRGPRTPDVLRYAMDLVSSGRGLCVRGNHDDKLLRYLQGRKVTVNNGLEDSVRQLQACTPSFRSDVRDFLEALPLYLSLDEGRLLVVHAGLEERLHNRTGDEVRAFCLYGSTNGETDEHGLPIRLNWAADYTGTPTIVYGHTPVHTPQWQNNTINIDTGCVFGGRLTLLRYPKRELLCVEAHAVHSIPRRPLPSI